MGFIITLLALGLVIFVHEIGHLLAAKWSGIGVYEFAVGMGPKIYSRTINETEYSLRILPFGGFVKLAGMDDNEDIVPVKEKDFHQKPMLNRFLTISSGSLMNIITGAAIFFIMALFFGIAQPTNEIKTVFPNTPAEKAGLIAKDQISINNNVNVKFIINQINNSANKPITITIKRDNRSFPLTITPKLDEKKKVGIIGIGFDSSIKRLNPISAFLFSLNETKIHIKQVFTTLSLLIKGSLNFKDMAGPVGIIQIASTFLNQGIIYFLNIMAIISISLGIINLFPFPVLDGGHLLLLCIEFVRRKRLSEKTETIINNTGAAILISLMILIVINDVLNWQERVAILQKLRGL